MLITQESVSKIIPLVHRNKDILPTNIVESKIESFLDLIKFRLQEKNIEEVSESVLSQTFVLKFDLIQYAASKGYSLSEYYEQLNEEAAKSIQYSQFSKLREVMADVLDITALMGSNLTKDFEGFADIPDISEEAQVAYDALNILRSFPQPEVKYFVKWSDETLKLETALIVANLFLTSDLKDTRGDFEEELIRFLKKTINRVGAYAMFIGLWKPENKNENQLITNMSILAATIELDHKQGKRISKENLLELVDN